MHHHSHGAPGMVSTATRLIVAQKTPDNFVADGRVYLSDLAPGALDRTLLVVWLGCETAVTSQADGNLIKVTVDKGAKTCLGFETVIWFENDGTPAQKPRVWSDAFWNVLCDGPDPMTGAPGHPMTVDAAARYAAEQVIAFAGDTAESRSYRNFQIEGDGGLKVVPAR